jgi:hypothetical protein
MTLTTARSTTVTPLLIPLSPGRRRVQEAVANLQAAFEEMLREDRERARQREQARQDNAAETERRTRLAAARVATRHLRIEVDRKWFWDFTATALDAMQDLAREARKQGQKTEAAALQARLDTTVQALEKLQAREIGGAK